MASASALGAPARVGMVLRRTHRGQWQQAKRSRHTSPPRHPLRYTEHTREQGGITTWRDARSFILPQQELPPVPGVSWGTAAGLMLPTPGEDQGCPPPGGMGKNSVHPGVEATDRQC